MAADPHNPQVGDRFMAGGLVRRVTGVGETSLLYRGRYPDGTESPERFMTKLIVAGLWKPVPDPVLTEPLTIYRRLGGWTSKSTPFPHVAAITLHPDGTWTQEQP